MENSHLNNLLNTDIGEFESFLQFHENPEQFKEQLKICNRNSIIALTKVLVKYLKNEKQLENAEDYLKIILDLFKTKPNDAVVSDLGNVLTLLLCRDPTANKITVLGLIQDFETNLELMGSKFLKIVASIIIAYSPDKLEDLADLQDKLVEGLLNDVYPEEFLYCISLLLSAPSAECLLTKISGKASKNLRVWCCLFDQMNKYSLVNAEKILTPIQESLYSEGIPRKQALFLIKKLVNTNLLEDHDQSWKKLVIIVENLDEKQFHLILPALKLLGELKFNNPAMKQILVELILNHENSQVVSWGIKFCFTNQVFDGTADKNESLMQTFFNSINKTGLYGKSQHSEQVVDLQSLEKLIGENIELVFNNLQFVKWMSVPFYFILLEVKKQFNVALPKIPNIIEKLENLAMTAKKVQNLQIRYGVHALISDIFQIIAKNYKIDQLWKVMELIHNVSENESARNKIAQCLKNVNLEDISDFKKLKNSNKFREFIFTELLIKKKFPEDKLLMNIEVVIATRVARKATAKEPCCEAFYIELVNNLLSSVVRDMRLMSYNSDIHERFEELKLCLISKTNSKINETYQSILDAFLAAEDFVDESIRTPLFTLLSHKRQILSYFSLSDHLDSACEEKLDRLHTNCYIEILHAALIEDQIKINEEKILVNTIVLIEKCSESHLHLLIECLANISSNICDAHDSNIFLIETIIERLCKEVFAIKNYHTFFACYRSFIKLLIAPARLFYSWNHRLIYKYHQFVMAQNGPYNSAIVAIFYEIICHEMKHYSLLKMEKIMKIGLIYGENLSREQKIEIAACKTIGGEDEAFKKIFTVKEDKMIRIKCALLINQNNNQNLVENLLQDFAKLSKRKPRYFPHSKTHCLKQRYLAPLVFCEKLSEVSKNIILQEILYQNNQPNICHLLEIILTKCLVDQGNAIEIFTILELDNELKAPNLQSLFAVIFIFCSATKNRRRAEQAVEAILPYTMGQNFGTRLYSQICVLQLIKTFNLENLKVVEKSIEKSFQSGNAARHFTRILKDFRYSYLNYDRFLTIDVVYHHLPRISGMCEDEIITYEMCKDSLVQIAKIEFPDKMSEAEIISNLKIMPKDCSLENIPVISNTKFESPILSEQVSLNSPTKCENATNLQQKIIPFKFQLPNQSLLATVTRAANLESKCNLIVVASLVSRAPNLGGLARSCEIFGVKNFIIDSLKQMDSTDFKSLSKSAEKWLKISEMKSWQLFDYLLYMKTQEGYCIMGAEQTATSQNVIDAKMPSKSILLLGHEKEGIPANLLSLLDITLEIPQAGVLRSLNVHVCGAIIIYEYARQHIFED